MRAYRVRAGDADKGIQTPKNVRRVKFYEIAEAVIVNYKINELRSLEDLETRLRLHILPYFGDALCLNITPGDVETYKLKRKAAGAANATINRELSIIKRAFKLAIDQGKLLQRPHIAMLSEANNVRKGFPTKAQFDAIIGKIEQMPEDRFPHVVIAYIRSIHKYGWRKSEFLGNKRRKIKRMTWSQVDFADGKIHLLTSKNGEARPDIPMKGSLLEAMQEMREYTDKVQKEQGKIIPWIFHRDGEPVAGIYKVWKEACKLAGCPGLLLHDFRRGAVRRLDRAGVSQTVAMGLTGHKTDSVYRRYRIVNAKDLQDAADKLEALEALESKTVKVSSKWAVSPAIASC